MEHFPALFAPITVGSLTLKNRVVMAPMALNYATLDGEVTERQIAYYQSRAQGGVGLIIVEAACVDAPVGREAFAQILIDHIRYIRGLNRLAEAIKSCGTGAFIQLFHAGRQAHTIITGMQPVAPSPVPSRSIKDVPRELSTEEIGEIRDKFIAAAGYAFLAGFDGVELHAAHGYLINQFLSPDANIRQDAYGGSLKNRARLLMEIVDGIKRSYPQLLLGVRLNIDDFVEGGLKMPESLQICRMLEAAGVDLINCSCGTYESGLTSIEPASYPEGWRSYMAAAVKKEVNIPVLGGGIVKDPHTAEKLIRDQEMDMVFLGRTLLADSEWTVKARNNQLDNIRPCIMCNQCIENNFNSLSVSCTVNPASGREIEFERRSLVRVKDDPAVAVIGGGPAGMQAALALSRYGFAVELFEKQDRLGGLLGLAAVPPHKERIALFRDYLIRQLQRSGVRINLNQAFTAELLSRSNYKHLIWAGGSKPLRPALEGWNELEGWQVEDVLGGKVKIENRAVIIIGGGSNGCEAADYLVKAGNKVTIIEQGGYMAPTMEKKNRRDMMNRLQQAGVKNMTATRVLAISADGCLVSGRNGSEEKLSADCVIAATGYETNKELYLQVQKLHPSVFLIGDALGVKGIREAVLQAETVAATVARHERLKDQR